jgi:hypothetical protein
VREVLADLKRVCRDRKVLPVSSALTAAVVRPLTPEFRPEGDDDGRRLGDEGSFEFASS